MRQLTARRGGGGVAAAAASASAAAAAATGAPPPSAPPTPAAVASAARKLIAAHELILELPDAKADAITSATLNSDDGTPFPPGARVYLPELHSAERSVASALARLASAPRRAASRKGPADIGTWLDKASAQLKVTLSDDQRAAVAAAAAERVLILTGGPGTGKTFVVSLAVRLWMQQGLRVRCVWVVWAVLRSACADCAWRVLGRAGCARPRAARRSAWPRHVHTTHTSMHAHSAPAPNKTDALSPLTAQRAQLMADMSASAPELASVPPPSTIHRLLEFVPRDVRLPFCVCIGGAEEEGPTQAMIARGSFHAWLTCCCLVTA
jgi:hypothetical protein